MAQRGRNSNGFHRKAAMRRQQGRLCDALLAPPMKRSNLLIARVERDSL
jgi:hypothetical protein